MFTRFTILMFVCILCAAATILIKLLVSKSSRLLWLPVFSFLVSIVGDEFLRTRSTDIHFMMGILFYFFAHIGFLVYALKVITKGRPSLAVLAAVIVPMLLFYALALWPSQPLQNNSIFALAVLAYILISCFTLAASVNIKNGFSWHWLYALGILCLIVSDIFIALGGFAGIKTFSHLVLPVFYVAYVLVALSLLAGHVKPIREAAKRLP